MSVTQPTQSQDQQQVKSQVQTPIVSAQSQSLQSNSIINSKMSLITIANVRYEGILCEVDPVLKSMTLTNVKSFGTEGRRGGQNEIAAKDVVIPQVQFKVDQIKEFNVIAKPDLTQIDPAIISTGTEQKKPQISSQPVSQNEQQQIPAKKFAREDEKEPIRQQQQYQQ